MRLYVLRHAETAAASGPVGQREVEIVGTHDDAARVALGALTASVTKVWSSPLERCAGTARLCAARLGVALVVDHRLLEISYGSWEGRAWDELPADPAYAAWLEAWEHRGPPGGESARALERRVAAWLAELPAEPQLLVAHAGVVRALRVLVDGATWADAMAAPVTHLALHEFGR